MKDNIGKIRNRLTVLEFATMPDRRDDTGFIPDAELVDFTLSEIFQELRKIREIVFDAGKGIR